MEGRGGSRMQWSWTVVVVEFSRRPSLRLRTGPLQLLLGGSTRLKNKTWFKDESLKLSYIIALLINLRVLCLALLLL